MFATKLSIFKELLAFLWKEKLWWLVPLVAILVFVGVLMIFAQGSVIAPFIYTLF